MSKPTWTCDGCDYLEYHKIAGEYCGAPDVKEFLSVNSHEIAPDECRGKYIECGLHECEASE